MPRYCALWRFEVNNSNIHPILDLMNLINHLKRFTPSAIKLKSSKSK